MPGALQGEIRNEELRCGPLGRDWDGGGALPCEGGGNRRDAVTRKDIGRARRGTPQSADTASSPCRGAFRAAVFPKPPLQGEVDAPQGADGGVHCRLVSEVSCKGHQGLALCFVGGAWRQGQPARQQRVFRQAHSDLRERVGVQSGDRVSFCEARNGERPGTNSTAP